MPKKASYGNDTITSLKGADRVRKRPAVIFGSDDIEGCQHSVFEILSNSIDEAREGYGNKIIVTRFADNSVEIQDFGRGIPVDYNEKEKKYYLSLKDLTSAKHINELMNLKIDSFKIEGRLKSEYYAATVVDTYRKIIDGEKLLKQDINLLYTIFNRGGYTDGYLTDNKGQNMFCYFKNENPFTDGEDVAVKKYKQIIMN